MDPAADRLPSRVLIAYALPALPLAVLTLPLYVVLPTWYATHLGIPLAAVGQALFAVRVFDALNDPVIGVLADRTGLRYGRRRVWLAAAVPLVALSVWLLFVPPPDAGAGWLFTFGALLSVGTTAALVPYWAWGAELAGGYAERNRVAGVREVAVVIGTLIATAAPAVAITFGAGDTGPALVFIAVFVIIALPTFVAVAVRLVPEPRNYTRETPSVAAGLAGMVRNRPFRRLFAAFVLNGFANGLPASLFLFFVGEVLQAEGNAGLILFAYFLSGIVGVPLWIALSRRLGKHRTWCWAMIGASAAFCVVPFLGPEHVGTFLVISILTGIALGADLVLPSSIQADVVDLDTASSGVQSTGTYVAVWGLGTKLALAAAVGFAFPLLGAAGFDPGGGPQSPAALTTLAILYAGVPVAMKLAAVALMWSFPVDAGAQAALRARIETSQDYDQPPPVTRPTTAKYSR
jgi:Na+/melibiose symporter-like transporter